MNGIEDRGDRYKSWYHTVDLEAGEQLLRSWNACAVPLSGHTFGKAGTCYGKLLLSTHRVLFEPMASGRPVSGPAHAKSAKHIVTVFAWFDDRTTTRLGGIMALPIGEVARVEGDDSTKWSLLRITGSDDHQRAFAVLGQRRAWGWGDVEQRDDAIAQIRARL
jgi:hypothetical protein